jgi:DNA excision repair protein ERCC-1
LLVLVDIPNSKEAIRELSIYTVACNITMILAWSEIDAGKYIETLKQYEHKSPDMIKEKVNEDSFAKLTSCLCQIKSVNKTDVVTLRSNFSCFKDIINAKEDKFKSLPGFGDEKVKKLITAFDTPFSNMDH